MHRPNVNFYYDLTWSPETRAGKWTWDTEGYLVQLCRRHAAELEEAGEVEFAARGDDDEYCSCEYPDCEEHN